MTQIDASNSIASLFRPGLPSPVERFAGYPRYNFGGGHTDPEQVPVQALVKASETVLQRHGSLLALYNLGHGPQGFEGLRDIIAYQIAKRRGIQCTPDDVLVTSGATQALHLLNQVFLQPNDTVVFERFSYANAIREVRSLGCRIVPAPLDEAGIQVDALAEILGNLRRAGIRPKYIYTMPTVQNPTGSVLPIERRNALLALAAEFDTIVIEDDCYADLVWRSHVPAALYALDSSRVIHVGSLSKLLAPSMRLGYIIANWEALKQIIACKKDGGTAAIEQMVASEFLATQYDNHAARVKAALERKALCLSTSLREEFRESVEYAVPIGGTSLWVRFPDHIDTRLLLRWSGSEGILFYPGEDWSCGEPATSYARFCFALLSIDQIRRGIAMLAEICARRGVL